jgi:hypothetical protein
LVAAAGAGIGRLGLVEETDIHQVAPSVLAVMGVPTPPLDGHPFTFVTARSAAVSAAPAGASQVHTELTEEEEAEVMDRLRGLGYVD